MFGQRSSNQRLVFWLEVALVVLTITVSALFRFYRIEQVPPGLFPDEATHALDALKVLDGQFTIYSPNEGSTGALWRYLLALNFALFGPSILSLRVFASAVGVISVGMAYLVVRELSPIPATWGKGSESTGGWGKIVAALAALLLAVSYWHVDLSRIGFSAVLMLLIQDATFFCLWRALASSRRHWFVLFGLGLGMLVYNYLPGKLIPAVPLLFFLIQWLITRRNALLVKHWRPLLGAAAIALVMALPFALFVLYNYQVLITRASVPTASVVGPNPPLQGVIANLTTFGLWPTNWLSGHWEAFFLGPTLTICFVVGMGVSLVRFRQPAYLFLFVWWWVMLLPGALASEGVIPHIRRSIGISTAMFGLTSLGLATLTSSLSWLVQRLLSPLIGGAGRRTSIVPLTLTMGLGLLLVAQTAASTFDRYFVRWGPSEAAKQLFHIYDLELAELMAHQSGAETVYLLPLDSAAGSINPLLDSITFVYKGQASYDFLVDDERTMPAHLTKLTTGKQIVRLVHRKVTKHTGADPKGVAHYYLEKYGRWVGRESHTYFDIETYELDSVTSNFTTAVLTPATVEFEGQMVLTGHAFGDASGVRANEPTVSAGDLLWAEAGWRKTGDSSANYQVALWLEDQAGHRVGQVDKPLLNNLWHRGTSEWEVGDEERDYYLLPVDPTTPPGTYWLRAVLYEGSSGRRLAPLLPGVGADLGVTLGEVTVRPPTRPPDVAALPIPERLDLTTRDGLRLLGIDPGFTGPLRPGDQATLSLWWQTQRPLSKNVAVIVGIGQGKKAWELSEPQPIGGAYYPTSDWPAGAVLRTFVDLRLPPDVEPGTYSLGLRLLDVETEDPQTDWLVGQMQVKGRARIFEAPQMAHSIETNFGDQITLLGYDLNLLHAEKAGGVQLTLYWQAQREMETAYKVFVHLLDGSGQIVTQVDREPQAGEAPTTGWLAGEVVVDEIEIPVTGVVATTQSVAVGLYDPVTGRRVPVLNIDGSAVSDSVMFSVH